jgi:hypothetical protein
MFDMAHPFYLREKARSLRAERRLSIDELAERLALPRSTIYYWVRDLPIPGSGPGTGWPENAQRKGTRAMKRKYRLLREAAYWEGVESYPRLLREPTFRDFVCLYIAEGYKRSRHTVSICNSEPAVMLVGDRWIRRLTQRPIDYVVTYQPDQRPEQLSRFLGGVSRRAPGCCPLPAEKQQWPALRACLAMPARSAGNQLSRHLFSNQTRGVGRSDQAGMGRNGGVN